jgi:hypothetical protein
VLFKLCGGVSHFCAVKHLNILQLGKSAENFNNFFSSLHCAQESFRLLKSAASLKRLRTPYLQPETNTSLPYSKPKTRLAINISSKTAKNRDILQNS